MRRGARTGRAPDDRLTRAPLAQSGNKSCGGPGLRQWLAHSRDPLAVCRAWSTAWRWKSSIQP